MPAEPVGAQGVLCAGGEDAGEGGPRVSVGE